MKKRDIVWCLSVLISLIFIASVFSVSNQPGALAQTKVLHIGASHVAGSYGKELHSLLTGAGKTVETYGSCGARAEHWEIGITTTCGSLEIDSSGKQIPHARWSTPLFENLMKKFNPHIVVISLGTNYWTSSGVNKDKDNINSLLNNLGGAKCYWVGATKTTESGLNPDDINQALKSLVESKCTFIDATKYTDVSKLRKGDTIHFTSEGGKAWAKSIFNIMGFGTTPTPIPTTTQPTTNIAGCSSLITCKEIDDVWSKLTLTVSSFSYWKNKVWDPVNTIFKDYNIYYGLSAPSTPTSTKATAVSTPQIDAYIKEAAKVFVIDAALIKAIMKHESSFNQYAVSGTGCKGLMQVCSWSSYSSVITKYNLNNNVYDAKSNIYVGTSIYASKLKNIKGSCKSGDDELKCVIAAYNSGEGTINGVATAVGKPASWNDIIAKLQDESYIKSSLPKSYYTSTFDTIVNCGSLGKVTRRRCKFNNLNGYVLKIFNDYQFFKGTI